MNKAISITKQTSDKQFCDREQKNTSILTACLLLRNNILSRETFRKFLVIKNEKYFILEVNEKTVDLVSFGSDSKLIKSLNNICDVRTLANICPQHVLHQLHEAR